MNDVASKARRSLVVTSAVCALFFGIPFLVFLIRIISGVSTSNSSMRIAYAMGQEYSGYLWNDVLYAVLLAFFALMPPLVAYLRFERLKGREGSETQVTVDKQWIFLMTLLTSGGIFLLSALYASTWEESELLNLLRSSYRVTGCVALALGIVGANRLRDPIPLGLGFMCGFLSLAFVTIFGPGSGRTISVPSLVFLGSSLDLIAIAYIVWLFYRLEQARLAPTGINESGAETTGDESASAEHHYIFTNVAQKTAVNGSSQWGVVRPISDPPRFPNRIGQSPNPLAARNKWTPYYILLSMCVLIPLAFYVLASVRSHSTSSDPSAKRPVAPLLAACARNDLSSVAVLVEKGADPHVIGEDGWTPLICAAYHGNTDMISVLMFRGANPNMQGRGRTTPLIMAAKRNHLEAVRLLLKHGARDDVLDTEGMSALKWAERNNDKQVAALLNEYRGK